METIPDDTSEAKDKHSELKEELAALDKLKELAELPQEQQQTIAIAATLAAQITRQITREISFSGPLPPPDMLAEYEAAFPGCADRVVKMAEKQLEMAENQEKHRHKMESMVVAANINQSRMGLWLGFTLAVIIVVGAMILSAMSKEVVGVVGIISVTGGLAGLFLNSQRQGQRKLAESKREIRETAEDDGTKN